MRREFPRALDSSEIPALLFCGGDGVIDANGATDAAESGTTTSSSFAAPLGEAELSVIPTPAVHIFMGSVGRWKNSSRFVAMTNLYLGWTPWARKMMHMSDNNNTLLSRDKYLSLPLVGKIVLNF